jgi:hypothetical protein
MEYASSIPGHHVPFSSAHGLVVPVPSHHHPSTEGEGLDGAFKLMLLDTFYAFTCNINIYINVKVKYINTCSYICC